MNTKETTNQRIVINKGYELIAFYVSELLYIKADGNCCEIHLLNKGRIMAVYSIKELEELLKEYSCIIKVHRSFLANLQNAMKINIGSIPYIKFYNGVKIPISRTKKIQVADIYSENAF